MSCPTTTTYAKYPTPLFNTPNLQFNFGGEDGDTVPLNNEGLMRTVETVLFPGTKINLLEQIAQSHIWRISTEEYNYQGNYYIDDRFTRTIAGHYPSRTIILPSVPSISETMKNLKGTRYIWGGNWPEGINQLHELYPSKSNLSQLDPLVQDTWKLKGVDCSGLLYYATDGYTPRNTYELVSFGEPIDIENKGISEISAALKKLDILVWKGHVICVIDNHNVIESMATKGVIKTGLVSRLSEIMKTRKPVNNWNSTDQLHFVARRWHPDNLC